jgi:hypothetical protein
MKFKVGDKVRVNTPDSIVITRGSEGIVTGIYITNLLEEYQIKSNGFVRWFSGSDLEFIDSLSIAYISIDPSSIKSVLVDHPEAEAALSELFPDVLKAQVAFDENVRIIDNNKQCIVFWTSAEGNAMCVNPHYNAEVLNSEGYQRVKFTRK